ncbi:glycosyltransferase family 2 protein [Salimicrobium sp. PL1-032A]|uniref:glycosyltransferase family 2 protein n=1 Tax=Salimicrobium sp. PL1-032A TaxID=3095364 RepID=UPI0032606607
MVEITIIIPHYNSTNKLCRLLDTIPVCKNIEVIVIDDNSQESMENVFENYNDRVCFIENNYPRKGAGICRNIGLRHAKGKWILFADSDDMFIRGFYEKIRPLLLNNNDIIYFPPISIEEDTLNISDRHITYKNLISEHRRANTYDAELNLRYKFNVPWSKLIKKELIDRYCIQFDEVIASNDTIFSTKIGHYADEITISSKVIYCVTRSKGSLTTIENKEIMNARIEVFIRYYKFLKENLSPENFNKLELSGAYLILKIIKMRSSKRIKVYWIKRILQNRVKFIHFKYTNPLFLLKTIFELNKKRNNLKNYKSFS